MMKFKLEDDDFTLFDLPQKFALDEAVLSRQWKALQSEVHPDRFVTQGAAAQRLAMQWVVRVNEGYQRLKDPLKRAAYLCDFHGAAVQAESNTRMPTDFLMRQMAWREALEDAHSIEAVHAIADEVQLHRRELFKTLEGTLDERKDWAQGSAHVRALMFVERFLGDVERRLDAFDVGEE